MVSYDLIGNTSIIFVFNVFWCVFDTFHVLLLFLLFVFHAFDLFWMRFCRICEALLRFWRICDEYVRRCFDFEENVCFTSPLWPGVRPAISRYLWLFLVIYRYCSLFVRYLFVIRSLFPDILIKISFQNRVCNFNCFL